VRAAERTRERSDRAVCLGAARRTGGELAIARVRVERGSSPVASVVSMLEDGFERLLAGKDDVKVLVKVSG